VITEGILNGTHTLVHRGEARSRDTSRFEASPVNPVIQIDQRAEKSSLDTAFANVNPENVPSSIEPKSVSSTLSEQNKEVTEQSSKAVSKLQEQLAELNRKFDRSNLNLRFGTDEESGIDYFQLYDKKNGDVVKQFPPEEILKVIANLKNMTGVILNENV